jgi:hypothetical protein
MQLLESAEAGCLGTEKVTELQHSVIPYAE